MGYIEFHCEAIGIIWRNLPDRVSHRAILSSLRFAPHLGTIVVMDTVDTAYQKALGHSTT